MRKPFVLMLALAACQVLTHAQAVVNPRTGNEFPVVDDRNGGNKVPAETLNLPTSSVVYQKPASATKKITSYIAGNIDIYIDPKKWEFRRAGDTIEYKIYRAGTERNYGILISEPAPTTFGTMRDAALKNAQKAAGDLKVVKEEFRKVNGHKVLFLEFTGFISGINFTYLNYYYTSDFGTVQFMTYGVTGMLEKDKQEKEDMQDLLNGLSVAY
jgi:hypothetical protein